MTVFQFVVSPSRGLFLLFLVGLCALSVLGQVPTPTVSPTPITIATPQLTSPVPEPPPVAPNFEATARPLPSAERIGVDVANQLSLTVEQAIDMALRNNNSIEVSRNNFEINEWNLKAARGVYDPLLNSQNFYESVTTPTASRIGGAVNGAADPQGCRDRPGTAPGRSWVGGVRAVAGAGDPGAGFLHR